MAKDVIIQKIHNIRYMGNKEKLLEYIIPELCNSAKVGGVICDIMAGTNTIGYALNQNYKIISNDVQYYSYVIGKALLCEENINKNSFKKEIEKHIKFNIENMDYNFFYSNYSNTYFSKKQCCEIDSIRYAVEKIKDSSNTYFNYLFALMISMCIAQSTTGHFAQFLDKDHYRVKPLRKISIIDTFYKICDEISDKIISRYKNTVYNLPYEELFEKVSNTNIATFYLDPPYTHDQYSRFYHILETVCKYDKPEVNFKAKYRTDRFMSGFCYTDKVNNEFQKIIEYCFSKNSNLVISYSNKGVAKINDIVDIAQNYYKNIELKEIAYKHSSQGKGNINIKEMLISMS